MRVGPPVQSKQSGKPTTVTIDRRHRVTLPEGWLSLRFGQRVFFSFKDGGVRISVHPQGGCLRNGRMVSTRVRTSAPRRSRMRAGGMRRHD